jgi:hypothetical protein
LLLLHYTHALWDRARGKANRNRLDCFLILKSNCTCQARDKKGGALAAGERDFIALSDSPTLVADTSCPCVSASAVSWLLFVPCAQLLHGSSLPTQRAEEEERERGRDRDRERDREAERKRNSGREREGKRERARGEKKRGREKESEREGERERRGMREGA